MGDDSDDEKDVSDPSFSNTKLEEQTISETEIKPLIGLPMTEASEAWMDDLGDNCGFEDSDNEDLVETDKEGTDKPEDERENENFVQEVESKKQSTQSEEKCKPGS